MEIHVKKKANKKYIIYVCMYSMYSIYIYIIYLYNIIMCGVCVCVCVIYRYIGNILTYIRKVSMASHEILAKSLSIYFQNIMNNGIRRVSNSVQAWYSRYCGGAIDLHRGELDFGRWGFGGSTSAQ